MACGLYRRATHVVTITEAQRAAILAEGIPAAKVTVIPNGVDEEFLTYTNGEKGRDAFVVTYIGTLGMAHRLETMLEAAVRLREDPRMRFRIVGEGARRKALEARAKELGLSSVEFEGERPRNEVAQWIGESDVCLVLLRRTEIFRTVVPSKMLEIMAVGRPIILGVEGEAQALLERAGAGIAVQPENAEQLTAAIRAMQGDSARAEQMGASGREFVRREFRREVLAGKYLELLERVKNQELQG
jgi:glycosyltransferase involved in cell wall biosynthesis